MAGSADSRPDNATLNLTLNYWYATGGWVASSTHHRQDRTDPRQRAPSTFPGLLHCLLPAAAATTLCCRCWNCKVAACHRSSAMMFCLTDGSFRFLNTAVLVPGMIFDYFLVKNLLFLEYCLVHYWVNNICLFVT